ncbi:MAG: HEAT repeat domain-containing protein [Deltaproteobacteria bacterium]|nr:HEAT repeat domain-containing protein [Deltaproteobacteria bacterium]
MYYIKFDMGGEIGTNATKINEVKDIIISFVKLKRAQRIYLPNNEILQKLHIELVHKFKKFFMEDESISLLITPTDVYYAKSLVYSNPDRSESLAFQLYSNGINGITFYKGVEDKELFDLISILNIDMLDEDNIEDDIVTLMWSREFNFIEYSLRDDYFVQNPHANDIFDFIQRDRKDRQEKSGDKDLEFDPEELEPPPVIPHNEIALTDDEIEKIRSEVDYEDESALQIGMLDVLLELLFHERNQEEISNYINIIEKFVVNAFVEGNLRIFNALIMRYSEHKNGVFSSSDVIVSLYDKIISDLSSEPRIDELVDMLNTTYHQGLNDVLLYLLNLKKDIVPLLLRRLPDLKHVSYRRVFCEAIAQNGYDYVDLIGSKLQNAPEVIIKDIIYILGKVKNPKALEYLSKAMRFPSKELRLEAVSSIGRYRDDNSEKYLVEALLDADLDVRTSALRNIVAHGSFKTVNSLINFIGTDDFNRKSFQEKRRFFLALAKLAGPAIVNYFEDLLLNQKYQSVQIENEIKMCVIAALEMIGDHASLDVLKKAKAKIKSALSEQIENAIRNIQK